MDNQFSRTELLIGKEDLLKLKNSKVAVFGIGGVGSFTVEGLVRAGVGRLVLIDCDVICESNINRQIHATSKTLGKPKVEVMKERILEINPEAEVETFIKFYEPANSDELINSGYDYIVDAIDTVTSKVDLIASSKQRSIPIMSSMGAGNKIDPTKFEIADIYDTSVCPLAKVMRKLLKEREVSSLKVVYSKEQPIKPIGGMLSENNSEQEIQGMITKRHIPGSISFVPSVAGLIIAGEIVKDLMFSKKR